MIPTTHPRRRRFTRSLVPGLSSVWLVIGASCVVLGAYYVMLMAGEDLADRLVVSPVVGMWGANALLLAAALLAGWRRRAPLASGDGGAVVLRG